MVLVVVVVVVLIAQLMALGTVLVVAAVPVVAAPHKPLIVMLTTCRVPIFSPLPTSLSVNNRYKKKKNIYAKGSRRRCVLRACFCPCCCYCRCHSRWYCRIAPFGKLVKGEVGRLINRIVLLVHRCSSFKIMRLAQSLLVARICFGNALYAI